MVKDSLLKTLHSYRFEGADGDVKMQDVIRMFRFGFKTIGGIPVDSVTAADDIIEYQLAGGSVVTIRPPAAVPEVEVMILAANDSEENAAETEARIRAEMEDILYIGYREGYCCE